ncbi:MAG TPA: heme-binding domain-containing protein [candidate division Zixibacteria bacterium]|nr:heme-binding domain-containing protein [candidate division Zixibacteria bacterium]
MRKSLLALIAVLLVMQAVPYGRDHTNPPVRQEPARDDPRTRELAVRACFDCHSNRTVWPWYSNIAPISWLIDRDVKRGRRELNFSEWDRRQEEAGESAATVRKGSMPPWYYPWGWLSAAERQDLIRGLERTLGNGKRRVEAGGKENDRKTDDHDDDH